VGSFRRGINGPAVAESKFAMTHKRAIVVSAVLGAVTLGVLGMSVLPDAFDRALKARFVGPEHVYRLSDQPQFLTEDLAMGKGRETLARDGFDTNAWALVPDSRSSSPDGKADAYFVRNTKNPNQGSFTVRDTNGSRRYLHVQLKGDRVTSCVVTPK
jgi:hypothetical protein